MYHSYTLIGHHRSRRLAIGLLLPALALLVLVATFLVISSGRVGSTTDPEVLSAPRTESISFWSDALGKQMSALVHLPAGYDSGGDIVYPVLYMLHGMNGDQETWAKCGLFQAADDLSAGGTIQPLIIVTPDGDNGYWIDQANNGPRYGAYVARDLVSWTDDNFRTMRGREARAIGGMSMGGHGALQLAMNFPDTFGIIGAHSVALRRYEQAFSYFGDQTYFRKHDPVQLFTDLQSQAKTFAIWLDIGADDQWVAAATDFHSRLRSEGIEHEWQIWPGGHDIEYWRQHVADYLKFYDGHLKEKRRGAL